MKVEADDYGEDEVIKFVPTEVFPHLRQREPEHFVLKVESFSLLAKSNMERYESSEFDAGGYKWKLILYPNGDNKNNGSGHISLYLSMSNTKNLPSGWKVDANFNLFVYNNALAKYLTFQMNSAMHFDWLKTEWGFTQLLPLEYFKESSNGYLCDDTCVFGAEIHVMASVAKRRTLKMISLTNNNVYTWKVAQFSGIYVDCLCSNIFRMGEFEWQFALYPKGCREWRGRSLSIFLCGK